MKAPYSPTYLLRWIDPRGVFEKKRFCLTLTQAREFVEQQIGVSNLSIEGDTIYSPTLGAIQCLLQLDPNVILPEGGVQ